MKKKIGKVSQKSDSKKTNKRSYVRDMIRRDMESSIAQDHARTAAGIQKPKKDIFKDDPCYGCTFAFDNKHVEGPFDRRFKCAGLPRIVGELESAIRILTEAYAKSTPQNRCLEPGEVYHRELAKKKKEGSASSFVTQLCVAQNSILVAAASIGELFANGCLECKETSGKPSCFVGATLGEYLNGK